MPNLPTQSTRVSAAIPPITGGATSFKPAGIAPQSHFLTTAISLKSNCLHEEARIVVRLDERGGASFEKAAQDAPPDSERPPQPTEIEEFNPYEDFTLTSGQLLTNEVGLVAGTSAALAAARAPPSDRRPGPHED